MLVFYTIYQQLENHVLQPAIMSRTVQINQLFVLVSVLVGVELFGILGALLAIPAAGVISVVVRDLWDHRKGRWKEEPTIGQDEVPVDTAIAEAVERGEADGSSARDRAASADADLSPDGAASGDGAAPPDVAAADGVSGTPAPVGPPPLPAPAAPATDAG
jgi:hypothetical protein